MVWIGMRLGGTVALQAAHAAPVELAKLVLWDPIIDGARYLEYLRERHIASLENEYSLPLKPAPRELALDPKRFRDEAIGFALSPSLRTQLSNIRIETHMWPGTPAEISVLTDPTTVEGMDLERVLGHFPARVKRFVVQHGTDWTTDTAGDTALVPTAALMTIMQQAGDAK
jgi:pimeloyl-ACP methyl ester carboxylesterase